MQKCPVHRLKYNVLCIKTNNNFYPKLFVGHSGSSWGKRPHVIVSLASIVQTSHLLNLINFFLDVTN